MSPNSLRPVAPPEGLSGRRVLVVFTIAACALLIGCTVLGLMLRDISAEQAAGRERGYVNRAQPCRVLVLLGVQFQPGDPCLDPAVTVYYNPHEARPTPKFACAILENLGALPPADCGP